MQQTEPFATLPSSPSRARRSTRGGFLAHQRNVVLVGETGPGKTHLTIAIACVCIRDGARGRLLTMVALVNRLEAKGRAGRQSQMADYLSRMDLVVLDDLGHLPFTQSAASSCST